MQHKFDAQIYITAFIKLVETQISLKIKILLSDNGPEFILKILYLDKGIIHQTNCVSVSKHYYVLRNCNGQSGPFKCYLLFPLKEKGFESV